jgi:hypothetical protein
MVHNLAPRNGGDSMANYDFDIGVIGGGAAGLTVTAGSAQADELLREWVVVLNGKMKLSTLASAGHPYPTLAEINKRVLGNFFLPENLLGEGEERVDVFR